VDVRSKRRFASCEIGSGSLNPFNQICWIDPTLQIERVYPLASRGNRCEVAYKYKGRVKVFTVYSF
jgi:hypothetical protein